MNNYPRATSLMKLKLTSSTFTVHTTGWVHNVLLLDWHRTGRGGLVHLEQGLARILPSGGLINVAVRRRDKINKF